MKIDLSDYDFESNPLGLNEYETNLLKKHLDFISYAQSLEPDVKKSLKIGFVSSLVCLNKVGQDIESNGFVYGFGTNLKIRACAHNLVSNKDIASCIKSSLLLERLKNYLKDEEK